jgi:hypothetical protein
MHIKIELKPQDYVIIHFTLIDLLKSLLDFEFF